jgi:hypothetical protein
MRGVKPAGDDAESDEVEPAGGVVGGALALTLALSGNAAGRVCVSCDDGEQNGDEVAVDCGGEHCEACAAAAPAPEPEPAGEDEAPGDEAPDDAPAALGDEGKTAAASSSAGAAFSHLFSVLD